MLFRKKAIGLDDLLQDHYNEQDKLLEKQKKQAKKGKTKKVKSSYDDEDRQEALVTRLVEKCHNQALILLFLFLSLYGFNFFLLEFTLSVTDYSWFNVQLQAFGDEPEIPVWGVTVFGEKVIIKFNA